MHNLTIRSDGSAEMMFYGQKPWHKLGQEVTQAATAEEAITAAKLDWTVSTQTIHLADGSLIPDSRAVVRADNNRVLGIVGNRYRVIQNREAFTIADALVGEKEAHYHTAGSLDGGRLIWLLLKLREDMVIGPDQVERYLCLMDSKDGSTALTALLTRVRVVCQNTLNVAVKTAEKAAYAKHTAGIALKIDAIRKTLGIVTVQDRLFSEAGNFLVSKQFNGATLKAYLEALELAPREGEASSTRRDNIVDAVKEGIFAGYGQDNPAVKNTFWAAFNGVAEYVDYRRGPDADTRARSLLLGSGARLKQKAFDKALELARAA